MKRTEYTATVHDVLTRANLGTVTGWARNSATRAAQGILRGLGGAEQDVHAVTWDGPRNDPRSICRAPWTLTDGRRVVITTASTDAHPGYLR